MYVIHPLKSHNSKRNIQTLRLLTSPHPRTLTPVPRTLTPVPEQWTMQPPICLNIYTCPWITILPIIPQTVSACHNPGILLLHSWSWYPSLTLFLPLLVTLIIAALYAHTLIHYPIYSQLFLISSSLLSLSSPVSHLLWLHSISWPSCLSLLVGLLLYVTCLFACISSRCPVWCLIYISIIVTSPLLCPSSSYVSGPWFGVPVLFSDPVSLSVSGISRSRS